jgi:gliding motility-associated-like protein
MFTVLRALAICSFFICKSLDLHSQCSPVTGAPPVAAYFNSGGPAPGSPDPKWQIALDSINGQYVPAIQMGGLPQLYHNSSRWISFSTSGEHTGNRYFFYKIEVDLPCFNLCGKSFNDPNAFCLNLDLYADNSVFEIYINGNPQSGNLGGIIPLANPFNPVGHTQSDKTTVSLCKDWKAGPNVLVIKIASSATVAGLEVEEAAVIPPPPDAYSISRSICEGQSFQFGKLLVTTPGSYFQSFPRSGGCDSNVVLNLTVNPRASSVITKAICEGETFEGHTQSGSYSDTFVAANGCDSIRRVELTVKPKPKPNLPEKAGLCIGDTLLLAPGFFNSYVWQDGSQQDHFVVRNTGLYSVTVTDECGTAMRQVVVTNGTCDIFFPTAFSPNHDRNNDEFKIITDLRLQEYHLSIYNRWGQLLFETKDVLRGWDGTLKGKPQPIGAYVWQCELKKSNVWSKLKGTTVLIR